MTFKPFPEIRIESIHPDTGEVVVAAKSGRVIFKTEWYPEVDELHRLVECWNACRKIHYPASHLEATDEYVARLETLRKEAWATAVELGANEYPGEAA